MKIDSITSMLPEILVNKNLKPDNAKFENVLTDFIGSVNQDQINSNTITKDFILGGDVELHEVMIAGEKAKTSLELLMEIRNKSIDMYKELTRMQI
jgi:flagellar hook-basal body complex protein FliE